MVRLVKQDRRRYHFRRKDRCGKGGGGLYQRCRSSSQQDQGASQGLIRSFIELVVADGVVLWDDQKLLEYRYPPIEVKPPESTNDEPQDQTDTTVDEDAGKSDKQVNFSVCFLRYLHLGRMPTGGRESALAIELIERLKRLNLLGTQASTSFGGRKLRSTELVRSVAAQLAVELKKNSEPLQPNKNTEGVVEVGSSESKQQQPETADDFDLEINHDWSAVENFVRFNKMIGSPRRFIPISHREDGFVSFSQRELLVFFCGQSLLTNKVRNLPKDEFPNGAAVTDLENWIGSQVPEYLIRIFLSDLNTDGLMSRQKGKAEYKGAIKPWSLNRIKDHLRDLAQGTVKPEYYTIKGYLLQSSIRSDGLKIQLVVFKMKELQSARFKR
ncbi:hypothetical protein BGZ47_002061, partial [Haplosporangium gracile]